MADDLEERIRARAFQMWKEEGCPDGRAEDHWDKARILVAIEDDRTALKPINSSTSEPVEIQENLGEMPGALTDQGDEQQVPIAASGRRRRIAREVTLASNRSMTKA